MDTVEKMIHRLPEEQSEFLLRVRDLILSSHPEMTEKLTFSTAFFSCRGWLAYFNPLGSGGLEIGFCKGNRLPDPHHKLVARGRKVVRSLVFDTPADFDENLLSKTLQEAISLNLQKKKSNPKKEKLL